MMAKSSGFFGDDNGIRKVIALLLNEKDFQLIRCASIDTFKKMEGRATNLLLLGCNLAWLNWYYGLTNRENCTAYQT
ncbi:hypothetical protein [Pedobacter aquatilis]|uniref:hypothetical protein n=1 Tax=Pedobacter aquatilis TaxID=351343 RepID=UPI00292ECAE9|nr:hypothetical protein [Pedobacter aquatilis]